MAATGDLRDIMDMAPDGQQSRPVTKKAPAAHYPRPTGMAREVYALMGERVPPIPLNEEVKYKSKPKLNRKVRPWVLREFENSARTDKLKLRHWRPATRNTVTDRMEVDGEDEQKPIMDDPSVQREDEFPAAKFDVRPAITQYTEEQYNAHLQADGWTKDETDYLFSLCEEYGLRWIIIGDRYNYNPPGQQADDGTPLGAQALTTPPRTTEELKARYYSISAKILALSQPPSTMTSAEFELYERMSKFDAAKETQRKALAEKLYLRTSDEAEEEKLLLAELKRIVANEEKFLAQRRELYSRIEFPVSSGNTTPYQTSSGLSQLLQSLLQADKSKKRRSLLGPGGGDMSAAGSSPVPHPNMHRDNVNVADTPTASGLKRSSTTGHAHTSNAPNIRTLTPTEEAKYGVTHHDRLQPGPYFRSERNNKIILNKPTTMRDKITAAIRELNVPPALVMPTAKNCAAFEQMVGEIVALLDVRKAKEKTESEFRVLDAQMRIRLGLPPREEEEGQQRQQSATSGGTVDSQVQDREKEKKDGHANATATGQSQDEMDVDVKQEVDGDDAINTEPSSRGPNGVDGHEAETSLDGDNAATTDESNQVHAANGKEDQDAYVDGDEEHAGEVALEEDNDEKNDEEEAAEQEQNGEHDNEDEAADAEADIADDEEGDQQEAQVEEEEDEEYRGLNEDNEEEEEEQEEGEEEEEKEEDAVDAPADLEDSYVIRDSDEEEAHSEQNEEGEEEAANGEDEPEPEEEEAGGAEENEAEAEEEEAPPARAVKEVRAQSAAAHKRSASVLSAASRASGGSAGRKRARK